MNKRELEKLQKDCERVEFFNNCQKRIKNKSCSV